MWETSRSRESEKASEWALITDKDKTSTRYLQPARKEGGFSTWCWSWIQKRNCCLCSSVFFQLSLGFYQERQAGVKAAKLILMTN